MKTETIQNRHEGRNVKQLREILGIKQEALAIELDMTQQNVSQLETRETIDQALLEQIAQVLRVPVEAIRNFNEVATVNIITDTVNNHGGSALYNNNPVYNYFDKWLEAMEKVENLYEALLNSERDKVALLQKMLEDKLQK